MRSFSNSPYPFIHEYCIEQFVGGGMQASFLATDCIKGEGVEERAMALYDFKNLLHMVEARTNILLGDVSVRHS